MQASETRMLTALRAEIAEVEHRLEEERFAAGSARQGFAAREHELEVAFSSLKRLFVPIHAAFFFPS